MKLSDKGKYSFTVVPGIIISGHFQETDTYVTRRPKGIGDWIIIYTLKGEGYFQTPSGEKTCGPGDISLLKAGVPHQYGTCPGETWNFVWAHFPRLSENALLPDEDVFIKKINSEHIRKRIYRAFKRVLRDSREGTALWNELCENAISEILLLVAEEVNTKFDPRVEQILHIISQKMTETIRIEDLAATVCLSSSRLSHLFKLETGETILQALHRMRLRQAALLLKNTDRTASEVALDVGYQSYNHFSELFRIQFGISPRHYKNST